MSMMIKKIIIALKLSLIFGILYGSINLPAYASEEEAMRILHDLKGELGSVLNNLDLNIDESRNINEVDVFKNEIISLLDKVCLLFGVPLESVYSDGSEKVDPPTGLEILIVDDNKHLHPVFKAIFQESTPTIVTNPVEAMTQLINKKFDLIILDNQIEGLTEKEGGAIKVLGRQFRTIENQREDIQRGVRAPTPVISLSASSGHAFKRSIKRLKDEEVIQAHVEKPMDINHVYSTIKKVRTMARECHERGTGGFTSSSKKDDVDDEGLATAIETECDLYPLSDDISALKDDILALMRQVKEESIVGDILNSALLNLQEYLSQSFDYSTFNMREVISKTVAAQRKNKKQAKIEIIGEDNIPSKFYGHEGSLRVVLENLLGNALKFVPDTMGEITVECPAPEPSKKRKIEELHLYVKDNGPGVPKEFQEKIFDPWVQAGDDIKSKYGGTGLGLSTVANRIENEMDGQIKYEDRPGGGACFHIVLAIKVEGRPMKRLKTKSPTHLRGVTVDFLQPR